MSAAIDSRWMIPTVSALGLKAMIAIVAIPHQYTFAQQPIAPQYLGKQSTLQNDENLPIERPTSIARSVKKNTNLAIQAKAQVASASGNDNDHSLPIGFEAADSDSNGVISKAEMRAYLAARLQDPEFPYARAFKELDTDKNTHLSRAEFEPRQSVIDRLAGGGGTGGSGWSPPADPGRDYVICAGSDQPVNDREIWGAVFHRTNEMQRQGSAVKRVNLKEVPLTTRWRRPRPVASSSVSDLIKATVIITGGSGSSFFTSGGVIIDSNGTIITNYHVAEGMGWTSMVAITSDGKPHQVVEFIAGNKETDVAILRMKGDAFPYVNIAAAAPHVGDELVMMHHSENRFYTYDRGYIMRFPMMGPDVWMETSANYAPGGSGCGIFNDKHELIGLVSTILYGDGPSLEAPLSGDFSKRTQILNQSGGDQSNANGVGILIVKRSVSWFSIENLLGLSPSGTN